MPSPFQQYLIQKSGLQPEEFEQLAPTLKTISVVKGDFLLQPGEVCEYSFFVEKGLLRSFTIDEGGKEHT